MRLMARVCRFLALPATERRLFLEALLFAALMRGVLPWFRFQRLWSTLVGLGLMRTRRRERSALPPEQIGRAVARAGRCVPGATCLVQALAGMALLARQGYAATLCIGVTKRDEAFGAHAWVECDGRAVVGVQAHFTPLCSLNLGQFT